MWCFQNWAWIWMTHTDLPTLLSSLTTKLLNILIAATRSILTIHAGRPPTRTRSSVTSGTNVLEKRKLEGEVWPHKQRAPTLILMNVRQWCLSFQITAASRVEQLPLHLATTARKRCPTASSYDQWHSPGEDQSWSNAFWKGNKAQGSHTLLHRSSCIPFIFLILLNKGIQRFHFEWLDW